MHFFRIPLDDMSPKTRCAIRRIYRTCRSGGDVAYARSYVFDLMRDADRGNTSALTVIDLYLRHDVRHRVQRVTS